MGLNLRPSVHPAKNISGRNLGSVLVPIKVNIFFLTRFLILRWRSWPFCRSQNGKLIKGYLLQFWRDKFWISVFVIHCCCSTAYRSADLIFCFRSRSPDSEFVKNTPFAITPFLASQPHLHVAWWGARTQLTQILRGCGGRDLPHFKVHRTWHSSTKYILRQSSPLRFKVLSVGAAHTH